MKKSEKELKEIELNEINLCVLWLEAFAHTTDKINTDFSSYYLKHQVEKYYPNTYISNDAFKAAAKIYGLKVLKISDQNECYNIELV